MSKSKEELNALKEEVNNVNEKLKELTPEELEQVNGGIKLEIKSEEILGIVGHSGGVCEKKSVNI